MKRKKHLAGSKKKGMELQIGFVVTLILVLAIFGSALMLTFKFFQGAKELDEKMKADLTEQIDTILNQGSKVAIPESTRTIYIGKHSIFGLGILNLEGDATNVFTINIQCNNAFDPDDKAFSSVTPATYPGCHATNYNSCFNMLYNSQETIKNYEKRVSFIVIEPKKEGIAAGSYRCDVYVCRNIAAGEVCDGLDNNFASQNRNELYDTTIHKITIIIP